MKRVAVIGGGPAGAYAAERLAASGLRTVLLDEKLAWEKPCGGGLTYKAYAQYPFLIENDAPKRFVTDTHLWSNSRTARLRLREPIVIYSRLDLNKLMLARAQRAGAQIEKERVTALERSGAGWKLRTRRGAIDADFCIVATGARNGLRDVGTEWTKDNKACAIGYYIEAAQDSIDIQFLKNFEGYIWVFPRCGHLSVGICGKGENTQSLHNRLDAFIAERGLSLKDARFYAHVIPSLDPAGWRNNRLAGDGWMAVGDAAGLVDPITGEGLYYAVRSGDLASSALLADNRPAHEVQQAYRSSLHHDFGADLELAARLAKRLFLGSFLFNSVPTRMIEFIPRSARYREIMQDLFAGRQNYLDLKRRLLDNLNGTFHEVLMSFLFNRVIPDENRVSA